MAISDLLYVATHLNLCCNPIPELFVPDMGSELPPVEAESLQSKFGTPGCCTDPEWSGYFMRMYDQATNTWKDSTESLAPAELKVAVAEQLTAITIYKELKATYDYNYGVQRDLQWRRHIAEQLIVLCP